MGMKAEANAPVQACWVRKAAVVREDGDGALGKVAVWAGCGAMIAVGAVSARQLGLVRRLPDPPGEVWASNEIVMSKAGHPMGIPDGVLGMASYGMTLALLLAAEDAPALRPVARAKLAADAAAAGVNAVRQVVVFRKMCSWCIAAVACTAAMVACGWNRTKS